MNDVNDFIDEPDGGPSGPDAFSPVTRYVVGFCPVCETGLGIVRVHAPGPDRLQGLVVCDECEAIWQQPDLSTEHLYPDAESPRVPGSGSPLYGPATRVATLADLRQLGWQDKIDVTLTLSPQTMPPPPQPGEYRGPGDLGDPGGDLGGGSMLA